MGNPSFGMAFLVTSLLRAPVNIAARVHQRWTATPNLLAPSALAIPAAVQVRHGRGDIRTKKGKIKRGTNGIARPTPSKLRRMKMQAAEEGITVEELKIQNYAKRFEESRDAAAR